MGKPTFRGVHWVAAGMAMQVFGTAGTFTKIERRKPDETDKAALKAIGATTKA